MKPSNTFRKTAAFRWALAAACAAAWQSDTAQAIDPDRAMSQYVRDRWGTEQGFPRGSVYAIAQTPDGYLWIGTESGLVRFDGVRFRVMGDGSKAVKFTSVVGLAADGDGNIWGRLRNLGLLRYRNGEFQSYFPGGEAVNSITAVGRLRGKGILAAKGQLGAFTFRNGAFEQVAKAAGVPRSPVIAVAQTGEGSVWLGTRGAGLFRLQGGGTRPVLNGLPDPKINCLLPDGPNGMWIGTDAGIAHWNGSELDNEGVPPSLNRFQILALNKDRDANLWVGTDSGGLLRVNGHGVAALDPGTPETRDAVTALFEDREGNLWIGGANGIERLRDSPFVTYSKPEGLPGDGGSAIFVDDGNRIWLPPAGGGLLWFKNGKQGRVTAAGLDRDIVYSIAGGDNSLWLGRQRGGLTQVRFVGSRFETTSLTTGDGLAQNSVYSVYRDRAGAVWAGTLSGGVSKLERGAFTTYTVANGLISNSVVSILETRDGAMWFATPKGLSALSKRRWKTFTNLNGLPSDNVNCLLEDSAGVLWAGTVEGISFGGVSGFHTPVRLPASMSEQILGLAEDRYGALWMATSHHVLRVNRAKLLRGALADGDVVEYGLADGLRGMEGVKRHRSVVTDSLGRIWMSLGRGTSVVDPTRLRSSSAPAIPQIQTLSADGAALPTNGSIRIPAQSRRIVFGYTGLSLSVPERVRFRYWLEAFDHGWSEPVAERQAAYTNLGPGSYRFRLAASNRDGVWSTSEAAMTFSVDPAPWQTWWFRAIFSIACGLAAIVLYRLRLRRLTARLNVRFEERLAERTRIARELHDTLLQGFISASMHVHVAADGLPADSQVKPALTRSLGLMRQVIDEGRNVVRGLRSTRSAPTDLECAFAEIRDEATPRDEDGDPVAFRVIVEGERMPLHPVPRDEVYRIGREALLNAFRHARARSIEIELHFLPGCLKVLVRDDGCGIEPRTLRAGRDGHWGLSGMRERADRIGARLKLRSNANSGTEIELTVPGHVAFVHRRKAASG